MKSLVTLTALVAATISSAGASVVQYNTNGSAFSNTTATLSSSSNGANTVLSVTTGTASITLSYAGPGAPPTADVIVNSPTNISYGFFDLNFSGTGTVNVPMFTFTVKVNDVTNGLTGSFVGTSAPATVTSLQSTINIFDSPLTFTLGADVFNINSPTPIVAQTTLQGQSSIQGQVLSNAVPEPGTMLMMGAGLLGVAFTARKKFANRS